VNLVVLRPKLTHQFLGERLVFAFETELPWNDD
jgi:hypothetical protein